MTGGLLAVCFDFIKIFTDDICCSDSAYPVLTCFFQKGKAHKILNNFSHFSHKEFLFYEYMVYGHHEKNGKK